MIKLKWSLHTSFSILSRRGHGTVVHFASRGSSFKTLIIEIRPRHHSSESERHYSLFHFHVEFEVHLTFQVFICNPKLQISRGPSSKLPPRTWCRPSSTCIVCTTARGAPSRTPSGTSWRRRGVSLEDSWVSWCRAWATAGYIFQVTVIITMIRNTIYCSRHCVPPVSGQEQNKN